MALRLFSLWLAVMLGACVSTPVANHASGHTSNKRVSATKSVFVYHVQHGDTLYSIGRRFGIDYHLLARRNHLRVPYEIFPGQDLYVTSVAPRNTSLPIPRSHKKASKRSRVNKKIKHKAVKTTHRKASYGSHVKLLWPVRGTVTSPFGRRGSRMHDGIDIGVARGTPVHAAAAGEVVYADHRLSGYGKLVIIRHSGNVFTAYAHNQRNLVRKGDKVKTGAVIARVGSSGRATGPHLHFEVRRGSTPVDPLAYLPRR